MHVISRSLTRRNSRDMSPLHSNLRYSTDRDLSTGSGFTAGYSSSSRSSNGPIYANLSVTPSSSFNARYQRYSESRSRSGSNLPPIAPSGSKAMSTTDPAQQKPRQSAFQCRSSSLVSGTIEIKESLIVQISLLLLASVLYIVLDISFAVFSADRTKHNGFG